MKCRCSNGLNEMLVTVHLVGQGEWEGEERGTGERGVGGEEERGGISTRKIKLESQQICNQ